MERRDTMIGDLHCHTKASDGSMTVDEIVFYAKRAGLDFLAITDHDTRASVKRAEILGARYGVRIIDGVEFSAIDSKRSRKVHILAYLPKNPDRLEGICKRTLDRRRQAGLEMIQKVMRLYPVTAEHISKYHAGSQSIYKQHIIHALMDLGYESTVCGSLMKELFDEKTGRCYSYVEYPDVYEALDLIHSSGAVAVLAHPTTYKSMDLFKELTEKKLIDGVELYHPRNSKEDMIEIKRIADEAGLIVTGGTDFHGYYTSKVNPLATCITTEDSINRIFELSSKK